MSLVIDDLKKQRRKAIEAFNNLNIIKNEVVSKYIFSKFKEGKNITFADLKNLPNNEDIILPVLIGGAIVTKKELSLPNNSLIFITKWTSGSTLTWHYHSDCVETIEVNSGLIEIYLEENQHIILGKGEKIEIAAGIKHQTTSLENSEIKMIFKKLW